MLAKRPFIATVVLLVIGLAFGATLVTGFGSWKGMNIAFGADAQLGGPLPNLPTDGALQNLDNSFVALAKAIQPTVVSIKIKTEAPKLTEKEKQQQSNNPFRHFFEGSPFGGNGDNGGDDEGSPFQMPHQGPEEGLGSGVIITSDGYILTNNHVVDNAAKNGGVTVKLTDKREFDAKVIGTDPTTDLAVVKIDATGLPVAALGNSDDLQIGEIVMAVGNPLGLESTVTKGIVSSLGRHIDIFNRTKEPNYSIASFIQTDAAINPGNSGGGLFNIHGAVIGINAAIATETGMFAGYGFAIPINLAKTVAMDLIKTGKVNRGYIGVEIRHVDATDAEALGLDRARGVRVDKVLPGQAGDAAGIKRGDIILSLDGREVNEDNELQAMVGMHHAGDQITLKLWRDGKEVEKVVKLKARDNTELSAATKSSSDDEQANTDNESNKETATLDNIGMSVRNMTSQEKEKYGVPSGVIVTHVEQASEAYDRGLGGTMNVITNVGHTSVKNASDFEKAINENKGKSVGLTVYDAKGDSHWVSIKIPS